MPFVRPTTTPSYTYSMRFKSNHDGDTLTIDIDLGCFTWKHDEHIRVYGVNAPEIGKAGGAESKRFTTDWFAGGKTFYVQTLKDGPDKYGRLLGIVWRDDDPVSLNDALVAAGQAVPYFP